MVVVKGAWSNHQRSCVTTLLANRGCARNYRLAPHKGFEPISYIVIMAQCSLFTEMLLSTLWQYWFYSYVGRKVVVGCDHAFVWYIWVVRHTYGIIHVRHAQPLLWSSWSFSSWCSSQWSVIQLLCNNRISICWRMAFCNQPHEGILAHIILQYSNIARLPLIRILMNRP